MTEIHLCVDSYKYWHDCNFVESTWCSTHIRNRHGPCVSCGRKGRGPAHKVVKITSEVLLYIGGRGLVSQIIEPVTFARCAFIIALRNIALDGYLDTRRNINFRTFTARGTA